MLVRRSGGGGGGGGVIARNKKEDTIIRSKNIKGKNLQLFSNSSQYQNLSTENARASFLIGVTEC